MANKLYKALMDFQIVTTRKITISKDQVIPEDFFVKNFASSQYEISVLLKSKKIQEVSKKDEAKDPVREEKKK